MILCTPPITIEKLINKIAPNRDFEYVNYRLYLGPEKDYTLDSTSLFAGFFAISHINGLHIIAMDGDTYSLSERVLAYEEWTDKEHGVNNGLTIVVSSMDEKHNYQKGTTYDSK